MTIVNSQHVEVLIECIEDIEGKIQKNKEYAESLRGDSVIREARRDGLEEALREFDKLNLSTAAAEMMELPLIVGKVRSKSGRILEELKRNEVHIQDLTTTNEKLAQKLAGLREAYEVIQGDVIKEGAKS